MKDKMKSVLSPLYHSVLDNYYELRSLADKGMQPSFIIAGVQKSGTSALYDYLRNHPKVVSSYRKEIHYFDNKNKRGKDWYTTQFNLKNNNTESDLIAGEGSPYYIYHPHVAARIAKSFPKVKIIILLRNPIDRAYSHFKHVTRKRISSFRTFDEALAYEEKYLPAEKEKIMNDSSYSSPVHQHFSFIDRGRYENQLKRWQELFPAEQFFIGQSEEFFKNRQLMLNQICEFLNISHYDFQIDEKSINFSYKEKINPETYTRLHRIFFEEEKPYMQLVKNSLKSEQD